MTKAAEQLQLTVPVVPEDIHIPLIMVPAGKAGMFFQILLPAITQYSSKTWVVVSQVYPNL